MDFGLDNEFESDDSFFDDPKLSKKAPTTPKTGEKKSLEDLFGFDDDAKPDKGGQDASDNAILKPKVRFNIEEATINDEKPTKTSESSQSKALDWLGGTDEQNFLEKDSALPKTDILDDALSKSDSRKSFDLLDDILPRRGRRGEQAKTTSFEDILKDSKIQKSGPASLERQHKEGSSLKSLPAALVSQRSTEELSMILEPQGSRRGRRGSNPGVTDVLRLFGSGPSSSEFLGGERKIEVKNMGKDIPDWLGGSSTTLNKSDTTISLHKAEEAQIYEPEPKKLEPDAKLHVSSANPEVPVVGQGNVENSFQANMSNLQTQESFLLVSLQLKKYEENLSEIKNQQQEILRKQENQFDVFLNKYIEKQQNMEQEMLAQQERINRHIRTMALNGFEGDFKPSKEAREDGEGENVDKIVLGLKQRHNEEFFLMEESYKKQIALLEKSSEQVEQRLSREIENTSKIYQEKVDALKAQHEEEIKFWAEKMKSLDEKHREETDNMKDNHQRLVREVKGEFLDQLERFKEQRGRESELFANSVDLSQKIEFSADRLGKNEQLLEQIQEKVVSDYNVLSVARERSLENKERDISAMRVALEKCRDQAEKDRSQLLALIRTLEQKMSEQNQNAQEERWALQQAAATMAARAVAFDREVEFSRASIEREREQLKTLKQALLAEQEKNLLQLTEEKLKLTAEKSRLEVSAKLVNNYEVEKIKTEAETAIEVAKELTEKLNLERSFVQRQKIELDSVRNKLMDKERDLLEREENVEETRRAMQQKNNQDRIAMRETKYLENRYKEKLVELQSQAISLSNREKKLAEEKLLVSKERLALSHTHRKCMLCQAEDDKGVKNEPYFLGHPVTSSATDPELIKLRFEALEDERNSEVSREDNSPNTTLHNIN